MPNTTPQTTGLVLEPKSKRVKSVYKRETLTKTGSKGFGASKKRNIVTEDPKVTEDQIHTEEPVNTLEEEVGETHI